MSSVLKLSWDSDDQAHELDFVDMASKALDRVAKKLDKDEKKEFRIENRDLKTCLPKILWSREVSNLKTDSSSRGRLQRFIDRTEDSEVGSMIISGHLFPLYLLGDLEDYKEAIRHIVLGIHFLAVSKPKVLHRNISRSNLMFRRENGKVYGVLQDFSLAWIEGIHPKADKCVRPSTSVCLHLDGGQTKIPEHIERFDLESLVYVMYWEVQLSNDGLLYAVKAEDDSQRWMKYNTKKLIYKHVTLNQIWHRFPNESYRPLLRSWLDPLSDLFAKGYSELSKHRDRWYFEHLGFPIPDDWELPGFDYDTLGGNVTFEKIWEIMKN
ncbi:hypothetical protein PNOK_0649300 [Pyrrhoderma noxium]|uniref:Fungal-type protein kinase domain-containing protein n=1 Tax=Pyrrhoderma noxium TaxID=2282107 RepID=A0A286UEJ9_9AGAM|nr:hypothetical protein PNOK_0649300 [Pyrrhoderma noxium]